MQLENWKRPALNVALEEIEVEGLGLDLHRKLRLVGLTYGIDPTSATLGWAAVAPLIAIRGGQALPISGLALHCSGIARFEVSFQTEPPGQLEYLELRRDPEDTLVFFFEGGTVRISCERCRAELILDGEDEPLSDGEAGAGGLVQ